MPSEVRKSGTSLSSGWTSQTAGRNRSWPGRRPLERAGPHYGDILVFVYYSILQYTIVYRIIMVYYN